jgi:hypothetical protein
MIAEVWSVANVGSRLALARFCLWRLTALSCHAPRTPMPRLSRRSGLGGGPDPVIPDDGVERGKQLAHDAEEGETCRFAGIAQAAVEASQRWVVPDRDQASHVERCAHLDTATLDTSPATVTSAVSVHGCDAGEGGDLMAIDAAEFGQFDQQCARDDIADARGALEQVCLAQNTGLSSINLSSIA